MLRHLGVSTVQSAGLALLTCLLVMCLLVSGCNEGPLSPGGPTEWVFPVYQEARLGFIDQTGRLVIEPQFLGSLEPTEDIVPVLAQIGGDDQLWGFIDFTGVWIIEPRFSRVGPFSEGFAAFVDDDRLRGGYVDRSGKVAIDPLFESTRRFSEGLAAVKVQGLWGFLDSRGLLAIEPQFRGSRDFSEGLAMVEVAGGTIGYIDPKGGWVIEARAGSGEEALGPTWVEGELAGRPVSQALTDGYNFTEGLAGVRVEDGTWGFVDREGRWAIEPRFFGAGVFSEGLAPIRVGLRWGYVDRDGEVVIEPRFHGAKKFALGLAPVKVPEKGWGFINAEGEIVFDPVYQGAEPFSHGLAAIRVGDRWGYIDPKGRTVWEPSR